MNTHNNPPPLPELRPDDLRVIRLLGKGATGTVLLVSDNSSDHPFALKVVHKSSIHHHRDADRRARHELSVLRRLSSAHPFLPHLIGSCEDQDFICWGIPFCPGGDLNALRHCQFERAFSPAIIRFYLAEIASGLEFLHDHGIVYRDLKPENVLVQLSGHVTLTDFDLSRDLAPRRRRRLKPALSDHDDDKVVSPRRKFTRLIIPKRSFQKGSKSARVSPVSRRNNSTDNGQATDFAANERSNSFVGTAEYLSPEVIRGDGHEFAVDWWALGILAYEMLYGKTPFKGRNRKETFRRILLAEPEFMGKPTLLTDLIRKLLVKEPTRRLGYSSGASEIKDHAFFRGLKWEWLTEVSRPPFLPLMKDEELTEGGICVREYFQKLKHPPPRPLSSLSMDERRDNVSLTEF